MSNVVVDTDVVSYLFKNHPIAYQYLSDRWVLAVRWGEARSKRLREYLDLCGRPHNFRYVGMSVMLACFTIGVI